jgi:hypothetical protein
MIEFWALVGLAVCDEDFRKELKEVREDVNRLGQTIQKYGFRLSCYELVEFQRVISIKLCNFPPDPAPQNSLEVMDYLHDEWWVPEDPCSWDFWSAAINPELAAADAKKAARYPQSALNPKYQHPYLVFDNRIGKNVPGAVDPLTSEPVSDETLVEETIASSIRPEAEVDNIKRFSKAKSPPKA